MDVPHEGQFTSGGYDGAGSWDCASLRPDVQPYEQSSGQVPVGRACPSVVHLTGGADREVRVRLGRR